MSEPSRDDEVLDLLLIEDSPGCARLVEIYLQEGLGQPFRLHHEGALERGMARLLQAPTGPAAGARPPGPPGNGSGGDGFYQRVRGRPPWPEAPAGPRLRSRDAAGSRDAAPTPPDEARRPNFESPTATTPTC